MSWNDYTAAIKARNPSGVADVAIVCHTPSKESVWASCAEQLQTITAAEVQRVLMKDRGDLFTNGVMVGGQKCRLIRDELYTDTARMNLVTKDSRTIVVTMLKTVLVLVMGEPTIHGRDLLAAAEHTIKHLSDSGY